MVAWAQTLLPAQIAEIDGVEVVERRRKAAASPGAYATHPALASRSVRSTIFPKSCGKYNNIGPLAPAFLRNGLRGRRIDGAASILQLQEHTEDALQLAGEVRLVAAEPFEIGTLDGHTEGLGAK